MLQHAQIELARQRVEALTGIALPWPVCVTESSDGTLAVTLKDGQAAICADGVNSLARGFFLLARAVTENRSSLQETQYRRFGSCGPMIDMSRNAVMKVEGVKRTIDHLAALGMNLLLLYTEDTFEVPEYPAFGYLRGGYTMKELKEIDDYADSLGVELVPCIQTLAHLAQFLQWRGPSFLSDQPDVLLIDDPATYDFIEAEIRAVSSCIRSRRINIGMDEAHGVGFGRYYSKNGPTDRFELLNRHLARVTDICKKYGYEPPIMWSDMFFRLGSKKNDYYDPEAVVPQSVIDSLPDVSLCYWDYYHADEAFYDHMLSEHARMGPKTSFAGGIWTWSGFLPQVKRTEHSMRPALRACAKHGVDLVLATMWGDDGAETNVSLSYAMLPIFSEACWQGPDVPQSETILAGECLTGMPRKVLDAWGDFYPSWEDERSGKMLIWTDPLYPLTVFEIDTLAAFTSRARAAIGTMAPYTETSLECRFATAAFDVCIKKAEWIDGLRAHYLAGDRAWLTDAAERRVPELLCAYDALMRLHRQLWERDNKRFGWEAIALRYGAVRGRLEDVQDEIRRYLAGELPAIVELDEEPRGFVKAWTQNLFHCFVTPSRNM